MPNTCFWKASHFCQDRKWIFLQPEDGGPASVHPASRTGLGSVKELICHSHPQMVEGRCTTHFSGLLFINRVSLATTSSSLTHSAASKWLPCAHQASWGQSQNENLQVQGPHGVAVWPARNMSFHWPKVTPLQDTDCHVFRRLAGVPQNCLQYDCNFRSQSRKTLPDQPLSPSLPK